MYPGETRPREKPSKTLLEKIFIMKPCTIMNHAFNLQTQTKDTGLDKAPSSDLQSLTQIVRQIQSDLSKMTEW